MLEKPAEHKPDHVTFYAAHLAAVESAVGTVIHASHVPFGGHILSLNEGAFLARATSECDSRRSAAFACYEIAGVSATFKSLAPATKKLGPMLSIMMQAFLFASGVIVAGRGRLGQVLGMILLSTWAFVQPFITLLISFGPAELSRVLGFYGDRLAGEYKISGASIAAVIGGIFVLKCLCGFSIVWILPRLNDRLWIEWQNKWISRAEKITRSRTPRAPASAWSGALRDMAQPIFLFSFALTVVFLSVQKEKLSSIVWLGLRPLALAFVIFYLLRAPWFVDVSRRLAQKIGFLRPIHRRLALVRDLDKNRHRH